MGSKQKSVRVPLLLICLLLLRGIPGLAQLITYQEKMFIHLDRNYYLAGEKIWFTVYCIEAYSQAPSSISSIACVELFDPDRHTLIRQKVKLKQGMGNGCMSIPSACNSGTYLLRCYTSWQRNEGEGAYGYNSLLIIDPSRPLRRKEPSGMRGQDEPSPDPRNYRIRFYPEGGNLVNSVENHVVFTVTDISGNPVDFRGMIKDSDAREVGMVETCYPGIGSFHWKPRPGERYKMIASDDTLPTRDTGPPPTTDPGEVPLTDPSRWGCAVEVIQLGNEGARVLLRFPEGPPEDTSELYVVIHHQSDQWFKKRIPGNSTSVIEFGASELSGGPQLLIVYDSNGSVLATRTFLVDQAGTVRSEVRNLKSSYAPRDTVSVELYLSGPSGEPSSARISVSVSRSGTYLKDSWSNSLVRNMQPGLLVPELYGITNISLPAEVIDLLQIAGTGPKGLLFKENLQKIRYLPDMEGQVVEGSVVKRSTGIPLPDRRLLLSFVDSVATLYTGITDTSGRFYISVDHLRGDREMVVQLQEREEDAMILLENEFSRDPLPDLQLKTGNEEELRALFGELLLNQQINQAYSLEHFTEESITGNSYPFFGGYDQHIVMKDYIRLPVMEEVFRELGKRVMLIREGSGYNVRLLDQQTNRIIGEDPCFFLDGVPFSDSDVLLQLDPLQLRDIRFKSTRYFVQDLILDGIIEIRSNRGDAWLPEKPGAALRVSYPGLPETEYKLEPDARSLQSNHIPLVMNSLCFFPEYNYRGGYQNTIQWIAPDRKGTYEMNIKVMDADGNMGESSWSFRVD